MDMNHVEWLEFQACIPEGRHDVWLHPDGHHEVVSRLMRSAYRCRSYINLGEYTGPRTVTIPGGRGVFVSDEQEATP